MNTLGTLQATKKRCLMITGIMGCEKEFQVQHFVTRVTRSKCTQGCGSYNLLLALRQVTRSTDITALVLWDYRSGKSEMISVDCPFLALKVLISCVENVHKIHRKTQAFGTGSSRCKLCWARLHLVCPMMQFRASLENNWNFPGYREKIIMPSQVLQPSRWQSNRSSASGARGCSEGPRPESLGPGTSW